MFLRQITCTIKLVNPVFDGTVCVLTDDNVTITAVCELYTGGAATCYRGDDHTWDTQNYNIPGRRQMEDKVFIIRSYTSNL